MNKTTSLQIRILIFFNLLNAKRKINKYDIYVKWRRDY